MYCPNCGRYLPDGETCNCQMNSNNTINRKAITIIKSFATPKALALAVLISINVLITLFYSGLIDCVLPVLSCIAIWLNYNLGKTGKSNNPALGLTLYSGILITYIVLTSIAYGLSAIILLIGSLVFLSKIAYIAGILALFFIYVVIKLIFYLKFYISLRHTVVSFRQILWGSTEKPEIKHFVITAFYIIVAMNVIDILLSYYALPIIYDRINNNQFFDYYINISTGFTVFGIISIGISIAINILSANILIDLKNTFDKEY